MINTKKEPRSNLPAVKFLQAGLTGNRFNWMFHGADMLTRVTLSRLFCTIHRTLLISIDLVIR